MPLLAVAGLVVGCACGLVAGAAGWPRVAGATVAAGRVADEEVAPVVVTAAAGGAMGATAGGWATTTGAGAAGGAGFGFCASSAFWIAASMLALAGLPLEPTSV